MTAAYLSSFDLARISPGTITLSSSGESDISINLSTFRVTGVYSLDTSISRFNHVISAATPGFDRFGDYGYTTIAGSSFLFAVQSELRSLATTATWTFPDSITVTLSPATWRITIAYSNSLTAIQFSNTECRRLFGFSGNFSGSSASVVGTELPKYIVLPSIDGASSASHVYDDANISSTAYAGSGWQHGLARSAAPMKRDWVQEYETKEKTFRRFAASAPDEFTFQSLFEHCRTGAPFATYGLFGVNEYQAYVFRDGEESFTAKPATSGNASQFHIPFKTLAVGRIAA